MKQGSNLPRIIGLALFSALVIAALPISSVAGASCKADVTRSETCANVQFTLWVREIDGDGIESERKILFEIKASSREVKSRKVNHVVPMSTEVADWRFDIYSCKPCGG